MQKTLEQDRSVLVQNGGYVMRKCRFVGVLHPFVKQQAFAEREIKREVIINDGCRWNAEIIIDAQKNTFIFATSLFRNTIGRLVVTAQISIFMSTTDVCLSKSQGRIYRFATAIVDGKRRSNA
jgi:hypothetical protein